METLSFIEEMRRRRSAAVKVSSHRLARACLTMKSIVSEGYPAIPVRLLCEMHQAPEHRRTRALMRYSSASEDRFFLDQVLASQETNCSSEIHCPSAWIEGFQQIATWRVDSESG